MILTDEERAQIRALSAEGKSTRSIAEVLPGVSQSSVSRFLRKEGLVSEKVTGRDGKTQHRRRKAAAPARKRQPGDCPVCGEPTPCGHETPAWVPGPTVRCWVCQGRGTYRGVSGILWRCDGCDGEGDVPENRRDEGSVLFDSRWSPDPGYWTSMVPAAAEELAGGDDEYDEYDRGAVLARQQYMRDYWRYVRWLKASNDPETVAWVKVQAEWVVEAVSWDVEDRRAECDPDYYNELVAHYGNTPKGRYYAARAEELRRTGYLPPDSPDSEAA